MKKKFLVLAFSIAIPFFSHAQWNGTTVPSTTTAKVGAGTNSPTAQLHVATANTGFGTPWVQPLKIDNWGANLGGTIFSIVNTPNTIPSQPAVQLFAVDQNQTWIANKLRIGATAATSPYNTYALSVAGDIIAKRCVIQVSNWADYVFKDDYQLPSLNSVEAYVKENNHLPGVPSEADALTNGVEVGEMNAILLKKMEEMTLYMIQLEKKNVELSNRLENIENKK